MELSQVEIALKFTLPARHQQAIYDPSDPIRKRCDFLVTSDQSEWLDIVRTNQRLHSSEVHDPWPDFLIAFASNGCGDYFAYDIRQWPVRIIYIDPDRPVAENLTQDDQLTFDSFEDWYASHVA